MRLMPAFVILSPSASLTGSSFCSQTRSESGPDPVLDLDQDKESKIFQRHDKIFKKLLLSGTSRYWFILLIFDFAVLFRSCMFL